MAKYKNKQTVSPETIDEGMKISKSIQRPNQTKEQTKLIAQGIQKGIAEYKKQQKVKTREQEKLKKKLAKEKQNNQLIGDDLKPETKCKTQWLPWILLLVSWGGMGLYLSRM